MKDTIPNKKIYIFLIIGHLIFVWNNLLNFFPYYINSQQDIFFSKKVLLDSWFSAQFYVYLESLMFLFCSSFILIGLIGFFFLCYIFKDEEKKFKDIKAYLNKKQILLIRLSAIAFIFYLLFCLWVVKKEYSFISRLRLKEITINSLEYKYEKDIIYYTKLENNKPGHKAFLVKNKIFKTSANKVLSLLSNFLIFVFIYFFIFIYLHRIFINNPLLLKKDLNNT